MQRLDGKPMETRGVIITAVSIIVGVQLALFAWLKADIGALAENVDSLSARVDRVEREVAFVRGQLSLALPSLAQFQSQRSDKASPGSTP